jgi:hypothetical protein
MTYNVSWCVSDTRARDCVRCTPHLFAVYQPRDRTCAADDAPRQDVAMPPQEVADPVREALHVGSFELGVDAQREQDDRLATDAHRLRCRARLDDLGQHKRLQCGIDRYWAGMDAAVRRRGRADEVFLDDPIAQRRFGQAKRASALGQRVSAAIPRPLGRLRVKCRQDVATEGIVEAASFGHANNHPSRRP